MPTFREFQKCVVDHAVSVGDDFTAPDDDWLPVAICDRRDGSREVILLDMPPDLRPEWLSKHVKRRKVIKVARIESVWYLVESMEGLAVAQRAALDRGEYPEDMKPRDHPHRKELLLVTVMDSEICEAWSAPVLRDGSSVPCLGLWRCTTEVRQTDRFHHERTQVTGLPTPVCELGYPITQLREFFPPDRVEELEHYMLGQTMALCEGRRYNQATRGYEPRCGGCSHGVVVYPCDVIRFVAGLAPID